MALYWTIDSKERLFTAGGEGDVTFDDAMLLLDVLVGAGALAYGKLFDGRAAQSAMTMDELLAVCAKVRSCHAQACHARGAMGPLALLVTPEQSVTLARLLGALAAADRPLKMFDSPRQARLWLKEQTASAAAAAAS
jgi:hypothetical protein